jgi:hypothetical protein
MNAYFELPATSHYSPISVHWGQSVKLKLYGDPMRNGTVATFLSDAGSTRTINYEGTYPNQALCALIHCADPGDQLVQVTLPTGETRMTGPHGIRLGD